ncbi:OmpA family protein [Azospirillum halopraeferens]|uniref:OmpA family protein n=1 Tax=Azospirillum halopraeferens TaxID=34010 RepID=UPI001FDEB964|nr:OmpA family protein [Azospirillum halopraeferens]
MSDTPADGRGGEAGVGAVRRARSGAVVPAVAGWLAAAVATGPAGAEPAVMLGGNPGECDIARALLGTAPPECPPAAAAGRVPPPPIPVPEAPAPNAAATAAPPPAAPRPGAAPPPAGAPAPPAAVPAAVRRAAFLINFDFGSARIRPESRAVLDRVAAVMQSPEGRAESFRVIGHTDAVGAAAANLALSRRRAAAVAAYLTQTHAIAPERLEILGRGEEEPADPANPAAAVNRRVEIMTLPR